MNVRHGYYRLDGKVAVPHTLQRGEASQVGTRIGRDTIGNAYVSTVFLALDHGYDKEPPMLFETLVCGGFYDQEMDRYSTYEEAEAGHTEWVRKIKAVPSLYFWLGKDERDE